MSNVQQIKSFLSNFTPEGQKMTLGIMRANKTMLTSPKGIASLFEELSKTGEIAKLEKYLPCRLDKIVIKSMNSFFIGKTRTIHQIGASLDKATQIRNKQTKYFADMVVDDIVDKKGEIVKIIKKVLPNDKIISNLEKAKTKEEIIEILQTFMNRIDVNITTTYYRMLEVSEMKPMYTKNGYQILPLSVLQENYKIKEKAGESFIKLHKLINPVSTNPEIVKIENILKTEYGFEYAHFSNIEEAEKFLQAVKIHVKKGTQLPKAVSTTCIIKDLNGANIQAHNGNFVTLMPLEKLKSIDKDYYDSIDDLVIKEYTEAIDKIAKLRLNSTNNPLHIMVHELEHNNGVGYGKLPNDKHLLTVKSRHGKRYYNFSADPDTAEKLCDYAEDNIFRLNEEIRTELRTKKLLEPQNFTADEQKLLDFWS